ARAADQHARQHVLAPQGGTAAAFRRRPARLEIVGRHRPDWLRRRAGALLQGGGGGGQAQGGQGEGCRHRRRPCPAARGPGAAAQVTGGPTMTPTEAVERLNVLLAHAWMVRTFLKHADEIQEDEELLDVPRTLS